jgi:hypothetical protein
VARPEPDRVGMLVRAGVDDRDMLSAKVFASNSSS